MYKIGVSSSCFELTEENFKLINKANIGAIEISSSPVVQAEIDYKKLKQTADNYNVELWSCHLPFYPFEEFDISATDVSSRKKTVEHLGQLIKKAASVGVNKFVLHPSGEPICDTEREAHLYSAKESLNSLAELASSCGGVVAVEDLPRTCLAHNTEEMLDLLSANEKLRVCFDSNHLTCDDNIRFIKTLGDKIVTVHISDYDLVDEKHWLPGEGKNDWQAILNALKEVNYSGVWMYELRLEAPKTITRPRDLTFFDIYENAISIFNNKEIQVLGVPNIN